MDELTTWEKLLTPFRFSSRHVHIDENPRGAFIIDQDRILFSSSFRRLSKKTQVHPLTRNDHIHNRLTHSLEVACVARTLGQSVGHFLAAKKILPVSKTPHDLGSLLYAACLAHDMGNPPLGHAGESAIQDWFSDPVHNDFIRNLSPLQQLDFQSFDGNAQGFRIVTCLENNKDNGGFRLTFPTLATFVKYPNSSLDAVANGKKKFNFYQTEQEHFDMVFSHLRLKVAHGKYRRHPLAYISEAADDICYRIIDVEDAFELKILTYQDIMEIIAPIEAELFIDKARFENMDSNRRRVSMLRTLIINKMIDSVFEAFKDSYEEVLVGEQFSLIDKCDEAAQKYMNLAKTAFYTKIAKEPKKIALEIGSYNMYKHLLDVFIPAACYNKNGTPLSYKDEKALELMGVNAPSPGDDLNMAYHRVIDFITGMTDSYATFISRQFSGTGEGI